MQILHPFAGSVQQYNEQLSNPDAHRPGHCPQCQTKHPLSAHGFYTRTLIDTAFDGVIRVRRYLCNACRRTVSLLPEFILPYLRSSLTVIALFLFGGPVLHGFSFALVVGIIIGTYSSVFVASPIVLFWHNWADQRKPKAPVVTGCSGCKSCKSCSGCKMIDTTQGRQT